MVWGKEDAPMPHQRTALYLPAALRLAERWLLGGSER